MKAGIQVQSIKKAFLPPDIVAPPNPPKNILNNSSGVISATYIKEFIKVTKSCKVTVPFILLMFMYSVHCKLTIIVIRNCLIFSYIFF